MERTLSIIKPDATSRNISGKINSMIEENGFHIIAQKRIKLSIDQAKEFYLVHKEKPFYEELVNYMVSKPVIVQILESDNAVDKYRKLMGSTNPEDAEEGTIRKNFALSLQENSVHGSDSLDNAKNEIDFFFTEEEIVV
tara:strand:- start:3940 stop:4356 length:417 start_codon:yes stop_codon:yes gene_type:complete